MNVRYQVELSQSERDEPAILNGAPGAKIFGFLGLEFLIQG
jgi:hypothetical protein